MIRVKEYQEEGWELLDEKQRYEILLQALILNAIRPHLVKEALDNWPTDSIAQVLLLPFTTNRLALRAIESLSSPPTEMVVLAQNDARHLARLPFRLLIR